MRYLWRSCFMVTRQPAEYLCADKDKEYKQIENRKNDPRIIHNKLKNMADRMITMLLQLSCRVGMRMRMNPGCKPSHRRETNHNKNRQNNLYLGEYFHVRSVV